MDAGIRNYKIKLKILSPTYIGSGESYNRCDYIRIGNEVCVLNQNKWIEYLKETRLLNSFIDQLERYGKNTRIDQWLKLNGKKVEEVEKKCGLIKFQIAKGEEFKNNDILSFVKNAEGKPYIPGSSIKGAIISALVGAIAKNNNITNYRDIQRVKISGISVSDSAAFDTNDLEVYKKIDNVVVNNEIKKASLPIYRECVKSGAETEFAITIDQYKFNNSFSNLKINNIDINKIFDVLNEKYNDLFGIDGVISKFEKSLDYLPNKANEKGVIILGGGTSFQAKSIISSIYPSAKEAINATKDILNNLRSFKKHKHYLDNPISPRALKVVNDNGRQVYMGFCKLEVIK